MSEKNIPEKETSLFRMEDRVVVFLLGKDGTLGFCERKHVVGNDIATSLSPFRHACLIEGIDSEEIFLVSMQATDGQLVLTIDNGDPGIVL